MLQPGAPQDGPIHGLATVGFGHRQALRGASPSEVAAHFSANSGVTLTSSLLQKDTRSGTDGKVEHLKVLSVAFQLLL